MARPDSARVLRHQADARRVRHLVSVSVGDPLAPFALRPEKQYVFSPGGDAAIGYRVRMGLAVASGDPIGNVEHWASAIGEFVVDAQRRRLRIAVIGAGERARPMWEHHRLRGIPIGRDVVVRRSDFTLEGRPNRNLRQAIQRSHNAGVKVEFSREADLLPEVVAELRDIMKRSRRNDGRGFSMILGRLFDGSEPDALIGVARDRHGRAVAAHRYLRAGQADLSLDLPIRVPEAPNGVDERLIAEAVSWSADHGVERVSLAFAPFPDLFSDPRRRFLTRLAYGAVHLLDPLISVERLYRYLRKFHAFDQQRYVMLRLRQVVRVAIVLLLLEFR